MYHDIKKKCDICDIKENIAKCTTTYVNLLLFQECASRLEHVGLNKYF